MAKRKRPPDVEPAPVLGGASVILTELALHILWYCPQAELVGCKLIHAAHSICYMILSVDQLGDNPAFWAATTRCEWVDKPPIGWDHLSVTQTGYIHLISRMEAATPRKTHVHGKGPGGRRATVHPPRNKPIVD